MSNRPKKAYEIGYGKPPKHTQFQPGCRPPNPRGRPREEFDFAKQIQKELNKLITVRENGQVIEMPIREAWMRRIVNDATKGKRRAQQTFVKIAKPAEAWLGEAARHIFWLIDSEYKDKKSKP